MYKWKVQKYLGYWGMQEVEPQSIRSGQCLLLRTLYARDEAEVRPVTTTEQ